jgi:hypothetical protein
MSVEDLVLSNEYNLLLMFSRLLKCAKFPISRNIQSFNSCLWSVLEEKNVCMILHIQYLVVFVLHIRISLGWTYIDTS